MNRTDSVSEAPGALRGMVWIVTLGTALGLAHNAMGLGGRPAWGLAWITPDPVEQVVSLESLAGDDAGVAPDAAARDGAFVTDASDPMAIAAGPRPAAGAPPEIPELDRPISIELAATKQFFDQSAALFVDARESDEYAEGHIPGAVSMPYEVVSSEPERLQQLDTEGRPIIVYCGGGACELSRDLAWDLLFAGHTRVTFYEGGFPEWQEAGYPVAAGDAPRSEG